MSSSRTKAIGGFWLGPGRLLGLLAVFLILAPGGLSAQPKEVTVRSADHDGYSRVVFDFGTPTAYSLETDGSEVSLEFSGDLRFDFGPLLVKPLKNISLPRSVSGNGTTLVILDLAPRVELQHFIDGARVVLDVISLKVAAATEPEPDPEKTDPAKTEPDPEKTDPDPVQENPDPEPETPDPEIKKKEPAAEPEAPQKDPEVVRFRRARAGKPVPVLVSEDGGDQTIMFDWDFPVGAAVFKRAGSLWVVFDEAGRLDFTALQPFLNDQLRTAEQRSDAETLFAHFALNGNPNISVSKTRYRWMVTLSAEAKPPAIPISLALRQNDREGVRIFIPLDAPGFHIQIEDPVVGDVLDIVPVLTVGAGVPEARSFAEFEVLQSAQGLAILKTAEKIVIARYANGVAVGSVAQLAVSSSKLRSAVGEGSVIDIKTAPAKLIDFKAWRLGDKLDFVSNKHMLQRRLSEASPDQLKDRRWDMARFYLGHGMNIEARAYLDLMLELDETLPQDPKFQAIRGLNKLMLREYTAALDYLWAPELDAELDIYLWRSLVHEALGQPEEALKAFEKGRETLDLYPQEQIAEFRLAAVRAALDVGRYDAANWEMTLLKRMNFKDSQKAEMNYLEGRLLEELGEISEAMALYKAVDERHNRRAAAQASFARVKSEEERNIIEAVDAIEELERLRYSWRGDEFELKLLRTLGQLYVETENYRAGLETLRQAVLQFPDHEWARAITAEMSAVFRLLYLDGRSDEETALTALALYYDFRELTPLGADGDQMIRLLSDRLVGVDLLDRAAELLDHQVRFRLTGTAQALIAIRLAKVYLLDKKAEPALEIIRLTRQERLPADIIRSRQLVEARILTQLGRFEEAEVVLEDVTGVDVNALLADIHWGSMNWQQLAAITGKLLKGREAKADPLSQTDRQYLIRRVISLSMLDDLEGLKAARAGFLEHMKSGPFANAFDVITRPDEHTRTEIREAVRATASVDIFQSFMRQYRAEFLANAAGASQ
ncbi:MAG: hypothetical protein V3R73_04225 [Sphingomonadales bacterium]